MVLAYDVVGVGVAGTGMAVPDATPGAPLGLSGRVDNATLLAVRYPPQTAHAERAAFMAQDLSERLGLQHRHHAQPFDHLPMAAAPTAADLAARAGRQALEAAGLSVTDVGLVILATSTPHRWTASACASAAAALGFAGPFMDVRMGCAGGLSAVGQGALLCQASGAPVLVMAADTFSKAVPRGQVLAALALGDAAAACVWVPRAGAGLRVRWHGVPALADLMTTPGSLPPTAQQVADQAYALAGDPDAMAAQSVPCYRAVLGALAAPDAPPPSLLLLHQTQKPLLATVTQACGLEAVEAPLWLDAYANTGTANALLGFHLNDGARRAGQGPVWMAAVGGGVGACALAYQDLS